MIFSGGPDHPPLNVILRGPHSKISAMGPEFLVTAQCSHGFRPIHSLSPYIYPHTPLSLRNPTEAFFSTWRWKVYNRPLTNKSLFCRPWMMCNDVTGDQCQAWVCHARRCLANENIYCDEDENLWPNPQDEVDENKEVQWGTLQLTFYCTVVVVFTVSFFVVVIYIFLI